MNPVEFIAWKRDGKSHDKDDLISFFRDYLKDKVPDYHVAAWLMAAFINGLNTDEKICLTRAIIDSGDQFDLKHINKQIDR